MTDAALALALALIAAPASSRHRLRGCRVTIARPSRELVIAGIAVAALVLAVAAPAGVVAAVGLVTATVTERRRRRRRRRARATEAAALQGALDVLVGELRVGAHPVTALDTAADDSAGAVAVALRTIAARARLGADVAAGMRSVARTSALPAHWERLAVYWQLAQAHGLAIATLMQTAQRDLVERERFASRVDAGMAGARTTAGVLAGLPVIGVVLGQLIGADPLTFLVLGGFGQWLLVIGVALACLGLRWSDRITEGVLR